MSRKHAHRAGNQPVTRRYVAGVVRRARDEIISAIVHDTGEADALRQEIGEALLRIGRLDVIRSEGYLADSVTIRAGGSGGAMRRFSRDHIALGVQALAQELDRPEQITPERLERAVNG